MGCPCLSLVPVSRVLKEHSISSNSGAIDHDVLAELLVSGLEVFEDGCELLSDDVSVEELSVPLVLVLSALEVPEGEFEIPPVSSRGVMSGLPSWWYCHSAGHRVVLKPCHLGSSTRLDPPVWHCL